MASGITNLEPVDEEVIATSRRGLENGMYEVAEALRHLRHAHRREPRSGTGWQFPSRDHVRIATEHIMRALFPRRLGGLSDSVADEDAFVFRELDAGLTFLSSGIAAETAYWQSQSSAPFEAGRADDIARFFCAALPKVRQLVDTDVEAAFLGDPSVRTIDEILVSFPGTQAILYHRIAHELHKLGSPIIARMISEDANARTGIDIHPGASIGPSFFIDHGTGVVIGETAVIGARVRLYQQVTLGARAPSGPSARRPLTHYARHPVVEDDVVIYAGATVLGRVIVGAKAVIGGNVWVLDDVPAGAVLTQTSPQITIGNEAEALRDRLFGNGP